MMTISVVVLFVPVFVVPVLRAFGPLSVPVRVAFGVAFVLGGVARNCRSGEAD